MPRLSKRRRVLKEYEHLIRKQQEEELLHLALEEEEEDDVSTGSSILRELVYLQTRLQYKSCRARRYVEPRRLYRCSARHSVFERDLAEDNIFNGTPPWLTDEEFLQKYRVHRESFDYIVNRIAQHAVFRCNGNTRRPQRPPSHQLMVLLHYLGTMGSGANNPRLRNMFAIGRGTAESYKRRCITAIRSLKDEYIFWPDDAEKKAIAKRIYKSSKGCWMNCIGVADGTLFPLTFAPQSSDAPDYHGRKHPYSLSVMIVNDDNKKIRMYNAGNPGCAHDSRVYGQMPLYTHPHEYFANQRYFIIGDSAFTNSPTMVSAFKAPRGHCLTKDQEAFNTSMGRIRVSSEHTIGMLKARFPILRSLPLIITDNKNSVRRILRLIECCVILHNLLIDLKDDVPTEWYMDEDDDCSDIAEAVGEYAFSSPFFDTHPNDERRQRCFQYLKGMGALHNAYNAR